MSMKKVIWTSFLWHLAWGIGLLIERKIEWTQYRRKTERSQEGDGMDHERDEGNCLSAELSWFLTAFWFQCYICDKSSFLDGLSVSLFLETKRSFPRSTLPSSLLTYPQSSVSCQVPERRREGPGNSFQSHCGRWQVLFPDFLLLSFALWPQVKHLAKQPSSIHCSLPSSTDEADNTKNTPPNPRGLLALQRSILQGSKDWNQRK